MYNGTKHAQHTLQIKLKCFSKLAYLWADGSHRYIVRCISCYVSQCNTGPISIHSGIATTSILQLVPHTVVPYDNTTHGLWGSPWHHRSVTFSPILNCYTCWRRRCCSKVTVAICKSPLLDDWLLLYPPQVEHLWFQQVDVAVISVTVCSMP